MSKMKLFVDIKKKLPGFELDMNFETNRDILGFLGASGSGKSMTLNCIAGLVKPDSGKIILNDRVLFDSETGINMPIKDRKVGFLFQNYALFPHMNVEQNIGYALNTLKKAKREEIVAEKIKMMQLSGLEKRYPSQLSGGQQQRVALARALAVEPEVLLLDEPFSALDNHLRRQMIIQMSETLSSYKGATLFVTHNLEEAFQLCNNIIIVDKGKKIEAGNKHQIFQSPSTVAAAQLTGCKNISSVKMLGDCLVEASDWASKLKINNVENKTITHIGIRAHYIELLELQQNHMLKASTDNKPDIENNILEEASITSSQGTSPKVDVNYNCANIFKCWPAQIIDNPFSKIIYLKLQSPPLGSLDYNLQYELTLEAWDKLFKIPPPWNAILNKDKLILMN
jgi:ABC-type sulfate/molybdate transport systems ATPase subunit